MYIDECFCSSIHPSQITFPLTLSIYFSSSSIVVDFPFFTPQISRPLPREKFAMLCAPSNLTIKHNHVFDIEAELPLDAKEYWIAASIIDALKHNCSGWHHMGHHDKYRTDDEHIYVSTSYKGMCE